MKIFITGGCGFIGSHLAEKFLSRGEQVLVVDNFTTGRRDNLSAHSNLQIIEDTICNEERMRSLMQDFKPDLVIHAAASYKDPNDWSRDAQTNVMGTAIICRAAMAANVTRLVYFQTALCYGLKPLEQPITLNHPILPSGSSYAISKTAGEEYVRLSTLNYMIFRLANVYGPRNVSGPLPTFYKKLTENQECFVMDTRRDFIFVDDVVECVLKAFDQNAKGIFHISSGSDVAIKDLFNEALNALGMKKSVEVRPRHPDDAPSILLDPSRVQNELGWKARTPLSVGVSRAIEYYKSHGLTETFTHLHQK